MAAVLVIESPAPLLRLLTWGLTEEGYQVSTAPTPEEATEHIKSAPPMAVVLNCDATAAERLAMISTVRRELAGGRLIELVPAGAAPSTAADAYVQHPYVLREIIELIGVADARG
jgi:DNA-binding response OmpR family regulator